MGGDLGEIYKYINQYEVVTKASINSKIILVQVYIIFALFCLLKVFLVSLHGDQCKKCIIV